MKLKLKNGTGTMTTVKHEVFIGLQPENFPFGRGNINLVWGV